MKLRLLSAVCICVLTFTSLTTAQAAPISDQGTWETTLEGRLETAPGSGVFLAYYDTVLDISWAADANINGEMRWRTANPWAAGLTLGGVSGWRLPSADVNGDGTVVDCSGGGVTGCEDNEMGYLYWEEGITASSPGPFSNVIPRLYWSGTMSYFEEAWCFFFANGDHENCHMVIDLYAWAVRSGDVPAVATAPVDLSGTIKTTSRADICAVVLAGGKVTFSCNPPGVFSLTDIPRENNVTVKRQIYADGFLPIVDILQVPIYEAVVMSRSGTCPNYNLPYDPAFVPDSAGKEIYIAGQVLLENTQTPICAMVLANGQYMFSCDATGSYFLKIPLDNNGQYKLQVYADGFAPSIRTFDEFKTTNIVRMARAAECL